MPSAGKAIPHDSAIGHVTGTALYIDDIPRRQDELIVTFAGSPSPCGRIRAIHLDRAREQIGMRQLMQLGKR